MTEDTAARMRRVREAIAAEGRKLPAVDHNGYPLDPTLPGNVFVQAAQRTTTTEEK